MHTHTHVHTHTHTQHTHTHTHTHNTHMHIPTYTHTHTHTHTQSPVWLSLVSRADRRRAVCMQFLEEFASAIVEMDTKETKL